MSLPERHDEPRMTGIDTAAVSSEISVAVARKALDQMQSQGDAQVAMIEAAKDVQDQSTRQAVKDGRLDVYA